MLTCRPASVLLGIILFLGVSFGATTDRFVLRAGAAEPVSKSQSCRVYIGTYTGGESKGIYVCELDAATGKLSEPRLAAAAVNPSFLALHPQGKFLYAVSEIADFSGEKTGAVAAYGMDATSGGLTLLNQQSCGGAGPCHLVVDKSGGSVLVANYGGGSVAALPIGSDGRLGKAKSVIQHKGSSVNKSRQAEPHAHSINLDPANGFAFAADLGMDQVLVYRFDAKLGTLEANDPPSAAVAPGSGPRHFAFHPSGKFAYVINEMLNTVTAFSYDGKRGTLTEVQTITTLPGDLKRASYTAEVVVHPSGKFLYGSNRGHDSLAVFMVDQETGKLTATGHPSTGGKTPRNFNIDPTGHYLLAANQDSGTIVVQRIDQRSGALTPTGQTVKVGMPVCVKFLKL